MIWVIVMGLVYDARWTSNSRGEASADTQMPGSRYTRPRKPYSVTLRWAASSFTTGPGTVAALTGTLAALTAGMPGMAIAATARPATARAPRCGALFVNRIPPSSSPPAPEAGGSICRRCDGASRCGCVHSVSNRVAARNQYRTADRSAGVRPGHPARTEVANGRRTLAVLTLLNQNIRGKTNA